MKKAQVSIEFLLVIGIILFLATFVLYDIFNKKAQIEETKNFLVKKSLCLEVSSLISGVYAKGTGTVAQLRITGDQLNYPLTIQPVARNIFVGDNKAAYCTIPINQVSNSSIEGPMDLIVPVDWFRFEFDVNKRFLNFENIAGFVMVSLEGEGGWPTHQGEDQ